MLAGKVIGFATSSVKHPTLQGKKMLIVQPEGTEPVIAVDWLGAGVGMNVIISSDGKFTSEQVGTQATPIRWSIIGINET